MEKVVVQLIAINEHVAKTVSNNWNVVKNGLQGIIDLYGAMGLPALSSTDEVARLLNDTDLLVYDMQTGGGVAVVGQHNERVPVNKRNAAQLIDKPEGYGELVAAIEQFRAASLKKDGSPYAVVFPFTETQNCFKYDNGTLEFSDSLQEKIADAGKVYSNTEKGQAVYSFLQKVNEAFFAEGLGQYFGNPNNGVCRIDTVADLIREKMNDINMNTKELSVRAMNYGTGYTLAFDGDR